MGRESIEKLTAWHRAQIGTRESGVNNVRYNTAYYGREVEGDEYPWCVSYIWCGFQETGLAKLFIGGGKSAYCPYVVGWARRHGRWVTGNYREGDLLFFDWDGDGAADHIAYCVRSDGGHVASVEGNVGDMVAGTTRYAASVMGAYRPDYGEEPGRQEHAVPVMGATGVAGKPMPELAAGARGTAVRIAQRLLILRGYALPLYGADGDYGQETEDAVRKFQAAMGLEADGVVGEKTWGALGGEKNGADRL